MAISLTNKRNTKIVDNGAHVALIHHGSQTCCIDRATGTVYVDLCGFDTVTTRGKINAFLSRYCNVRASVQRNKGKTILYFFSKGMPHIEPLDVIDNYSFTY